MMSWPRESVTVENKEVYLDDSGMDNVYIPDRSGNVLALQSVQGTCYAKCYRPTVLHRISAFEMRNDDILLCAFPRTGTHWVFEKVSMLLNGTADTIKKFKGKHQLEVKSAEKLEVLPSPRVLNTHMYVSDGPEQLAEKKCKIIYNVRDPKDVAVSLYNFYFDAPFCQYKGTFEDFLYLFLDGKVDCNGLFGHYRNAEKFAEEHPDQAFHIHTYEEAMKNPLQEIQALSDFLELPRNDSLCQAIAEKCVMSKMKVDKDPYASKYYGQSKLYRKGVVGDWQNWFTDQMLEDYYRVYEEEMAGSRFYERYAKEKLERLNRTKIDKNYPEY